MNLALDEVLTRRVGSGEHRPTLRFWGWSEPVVVLGRFQSISNEVDEEAAEREGVTVVRRMTGGGAMFTEPENPGVSRQAAPSVLPAVAAGQNHSAP